MKSIRFRFLACLVLTLSWMGPTVLAGTKYSKILPRQNKRVYRAIAMEDGDDNIVSAAFAAFVRARGTGREMFQTAIEIKKRKNDFYPDLLLTMAIMQGANIQTVIDAYDKNDRDQAKIVADIMSVAAQGIYYSFERDKQKVFEDAMMVPKQLILAKEPDVRAAAILAAAYGNNVSASSHVEAAEGGKGVTGAKLLYSAIMGKELDVQLIKDAFKLEDRIYPNNDWRLMGPFGVLPDRVTTCEAIAIAGMTNAIGPVMTCIKHEDLRVQIAGIKCLKSLGDKRAAASLAKLLPDCPWPVLIPLCDTLGTLPEKRVIPSLMKRLQKETGRFRQDVIYSLSSIVGEQVGTNMAEWVTWYRESYEGFEVDPAKTEAFRSANKVRDMKVAMPASWFGMPIASTRVSFITDLTSSVAGGRIYAIRKNTFEALKNLSPDSKFNLFDYHDDINSFGRALIDDRRMVMRRVLEMPVGDKHPPDPNNPGVFYSDTCRSSDAIFLAMRQADVDTIFFVTDSNLEMSRFGTYGQISQAWTIMNRFRPLAFYGVNLDLAGTVRTQAMVEMAQPHGTSIAFDAGKPGDEKLYIREADAPKE